MRRGFYQGVGFEYDNRRWLVCSWNDTDNLWICKDHDGNYRYFSNSQLETILFEITKKFLDSYYYYF